MKRLRVAFIGTAAVVGFVFATFAIGYMIGYSLAINDTVPVSEFTGRVLDAGTGKPLEGVSVTGVVENERGCGILLLKHILSGRGTTDNLGNFDVHMRVPQQYGAIWLVVSADKYESAKVPITAHSEIVVRLKPNR